MTLAEKLAERDTAMTVAEVAYILQVSQRLVYRMAADGEIPSFKLAGAIRFDPQVLSGWMERTAQQPARVSLGQLAEVTAKIQEASKWLSSNPQEDEMLSMSTMKLGGYFDGSRALTLTEVSEWLGIGELAISQMVLSGEIPSLRFGPLRS